jgi:NACalpha-BTF3-like transcription factor
MENEWQLVYTTDTTVKAEFIRQKLENEGLHVVIINKKDSSYNIGEAEVYVLKVELEQAVELLKIIDRE